MENEIVEEVSTENPPAPVEETSPAEAPKDDLEAKNRQLFERTKKAEEAAKVLREENEMLKKQPNSSSISTIDLIKVGKKFEQFNDEEIDYIKEFANSDDPKKILEAAENKFVKAGIESIRAKVDKERVLNPSTRQPETEKPKTLDEFLEEKSKAVPAFTVSDDVEKTLADQGLWKPPRKGGHSRIPLSNG